MRFRACVWNHKIDRTIADLEGEATLSPEHVAEAIQYLTLDRKF